MRNRIALAAVAALALSACDMFGAGREEKGERNETAEEETKNGSSEREGEGEEGSERRERGSEDSGSDGGRGSDSGSSEEGEEDGGRSSGGDAALERDLQRAVRQQQSRLPMRDGPGTVTEMEADGNRLIVVMEVEQDFGQSEWDQMASALQRNICGDRNSRRMIERGAEVVYRITDSDGERVNLTTNSCDG